MCVCHCSAEFDTIQHDVLLGKLELYGVNKKSLDWFKDYLSERSQYVSIGGIASEIRKIEDGAFQGSIGGPWCFLIMINDIVVVGAGNEITVYIYADDTCLRVTLSGNINEDQEKLDELMRKIVAYMNSAKLKFNFKKTEFVVTAPKRHEDYKELVLNFEGMVVKQQLHARLLGLQVSWNLTHEWYVAGMKDNLICSLNKRLYVLQKLQNKCPKKCLKNLAHGLIYSKLNFGIQYWSRPLSDELWKKIQVIINKAARIVLKVKPLQMHVRDLYRVLDWLPANECRDFADLNLFWSIKHYETPLNLSNMFKSHNQELNVNDGRRVTRSITQNSINRTQENDSRLSVRAESFVPRMVKTFNELDQEFKSLPDLRDKYGNPVSTEEKFKDLKCSLRRMVQWRALGPPTEWPADRDEAILDRGDEIYGLGILSDTSEDELEES